MTTALPSPSLSWTLVSRPFVFLILLLCAAPAAHGALLPGSEPKEWPANPAKHVAVIRREAADKKQAELIAKAEAAKPVPAQTGGDKGKTEQTTAKPGEAKKNGHENDWWQEEKLGIRIPRAVTGEAVAYYTKLIEGYGKQPLKRYLEPSSRLDYTATVKAHEEFSVDGKSFRKVQVVTLKLSFSQNFAATVTEGMSFTKERVVVLDAEGKVLHVSGDGPTEAMILAI